MRGTHQHWQKQGEDHRLDISLENQQTGMGNDANVWSQMWAFDCTRADNNYSYLCHHVFRNTRMNMHTHIHTYFRRASTLSHTRTHARTVWAVTVQACTMSSSEPSALPMDCSLSLWCLRPMHLRCVISGLLRWLLCYRHFFPKSACSRESTTYTWWSYHALILHRQSMRISERGSIDEHLLESFSSTQIYP